MINYIYDIYSVSTKTKTKKQVKDLLKAESKSYAYVAKTRISFFHRPGISYPDFVSDKINESSFFYIGSREDEKKYMLIYIDHEVVFSGLVTPGEAKSKIHLYHSAIESGVKIYLDQCEFPFLEQHDPIQLNGDFANNINLKKYQLRYVQRIIDSNNAFKKLVIQTAVVGAVIFAGITIYLEYQDNIEQHNTEVKQQKIVDTWKPFHNAMTFPNPSAELTQFSQALTPIRTLSTVTTTRINYSQGLLNLTLANYDFPAVRMIHWSKKNGFALTNTNQRGFALSKRVITQPIKRGDTIVPLPELRAIFMDHYRFISDSSQETASVGTVTRRNNFALMPLTVRISNIPLAALSSHFKFLDKYPVSLQSINGNEVLGEFTGTIQFNTIGSN